MKKLLLFFAALLPCFLAFSQEADGTGRSVDVQIIPRFEFNPYFTPGQSGDGSSGSSFGNSSLYTLVEATLSDHVSFTLSNHWLATPHTGWEETAALYKSTLYSNSNNWVDIAKVDFTFGNWIFTLGKDCMATGGFEYDAWDVDVDYMLIGDTPILASYLWNNLPSYQWGAKVGYALGETTQFGLQMTTSPFGERPFASGLYSYSAKWDGNYGPVANMWSASAVQRPDGGFEWLVALAQQVELGDFVLGFDWYNIADVDYGPEDDTPCEFIKGNTFRPRMAWAPSEKFDMGAACNIYTRMGSLYDLNAGAFFHYYPLQAIQLHAAFGWDKNTGALAAMAGLKVNLHIFQR
ncbi:MAG: hypothetical protein J6O51_11030 [Bacteroidales bacterium]|nr:hypothetical protein [Bacteroidales bacterium]